VVYSTFRSRKAKDPPQSFLDCVRYFLTPQVWKQAQRAMRPSRGIRWQPQPLIFVLLTMTWCWGDSVSERFETAKAFYIASYQRQRRPGKTVEGFQKALARVPAAALRVLAAAVRGRLAHVFADRLLVDGFVPLGCDGSRVECPRSRELERRLPVGAKHDSPPMVWVTAFVHLSLGVPWSWRLGKGTASERGHLLRLLPTLPPLALIVADAGYVGYELLLGLARAKRSFLIRLSSKAPLYTTERGPVSKFREGLLYYWPQKMQEAERPPLLVRVLRIRGPKADVWLMTNVLDPEKLSRPSARTFYRWRWRNEGLFRSYKRTLGKVKLMSRTVVQVHRELEGSLLAVQLLLAHDALALKLAGKPRRVLPSARHVQLAIRSEIRNVTGTYLGPRQTQTYLERLQHARRDTRRHRTDKVRRRWPARKDHKPPGAPKIQRMGTILKDLMDKTLEAA
jgi:Transposase DDE domain